MPRAICLEVKAVPGSGFPLLRHGYFSFLYCFSKE